MSISGGDIKALVLAGERGGPSALREAEDVASKAEIEIDGIAMLDRVLGALSESRITAPCHIAGAHPLTRERLASSAAGLRMSCVVHHERSERTWQRTDSKGGEKALSHICK